MKGSETAVDKLVKSILAKAWDLGGKELAVWKRPQAEIRKLVQTDYRANLRRQLTPQQVEHLVSRATKIWPHFNRQSLGPPSKKEFSDVAGALNLHLKAAPYAGLALRGFYLDRSDTSRRKPLIYVNSAHHRLAVGTTFCHEVGHHLSAEILNSPAAGVRLYFDAVYSTHLIDKGELAADIIASVAGYPKPAAQDIFSVPALKDGLNIRNLGDLVFARIRSYIKQHYGFDFPAQMQPSQNLHYLAGMIHYAKLRQALLSEYGI